MKTNRILAVTGVVCTLLAGVALALEAGDFTVLDPALDEFPDATSLVGMDALSDGSVLVYDGANVYVRGTEEDAVFDAGTAVYTNTGANDVGSEGFVAAGPSGGALVGAADGAMWLVDTEGAAEELVVADAPTDGVVFGEFIGAGSLLVSSGTELGLVDFNTADIGAGGTYTAVVEYNTTSMAPRGIVCIDDNVYVGDASGAIRSFAVADLTEATEALSPEDGRAFASAPNFGPYGILGPTGATAEGNLLVGGIGTIEVVQAEGGFLRRDGRVFETVDFGTELIYLPISVDGTILVADDTGVGQEAVADVDPGFFQNLFAPITQFFQWLWSLILGLFGLGA